jgi:hypothetical protein
MEGPNPLTNETRAEFRAARAAPAGDAAMTSEELRRWAVLLDSAFTVPGTRIRFGLDAILGLVPFLGDLTASLFTAAILLSGFRRRIPAIVQARMVANVGIDMFIGTIPILGDLFDVAWKANLRNLDLLERHARPGVPPTSADYLVVFLFVGAVGALLTAPILLVAGVLWEFGFV